MESLYILTTEALNRDGYAEAHTPFRKWVTPELMEELAALPQDRKARRTGGIRFPERHSPIVRELINSRETRLLVQPAVGDDFDFVRGILFDKTPEANWKVPWHQDTTIAVREKKEVSGYGPWTLKDGIHHVQPPPEILEAMITLRIHLDPCYEANGPLRVIGGTHNRGRLSQTEIDRLVAERDVTTCTGATGSAVLMRPLLLHASSPATTPTHRRILHLEFCGRKLDGKLAWN